MAALDLLATNLYKFSFHLCAQPYIVLAITYKKTDLQCRPV